MRIGRFVETNNLLSYKQAGFRKREECVGQVVSLVDIIQRRQNAGLNTHVLFIDIRKAFNTVPVGALLWKLQNMGFPRRTLAFLKAFYTSSSARARAGSLLSDPFPVQRGVRQGRPCLTPLCTGNGSDSSEPARARADEDVYKCLEKCKSTTRESHVLQLP
ncbi:hypothetical protein BASA61_005910 [Batrachochytrium salamandrivorans]|nr:hypothetical protein BASA61_005910 [Batrachochytrium salamandrivorans]